MQNQSGLTFLLKGEIFCEVATLVVTPENILNSFNGKRLRQRPEQEESGRVAELQRPQVQHTLQSDQMLRGLWPSKLDE